MHACRSTLEDPTVALGGAAAGIAPAGLPDRLTALGLPPDLLRLVTALYERAYPLLRARVLARTLGEHGEVVLGVDWRVDQIRASNHGDTTGLAVVLLTFRVQRGEKPMRYTLQFMPEQLAELRAALDHLSPGP